MKKFYVSLSILIAMMGTVYGQSQRLVLFEEFTQASCGPCAQQNPTFDGLLNSNAAKCTSVKYHTSWPGVDPMNAQNPEDVSTRVAYYNVTGVPDAQMDGMTPTGTSYAGAPANVTQTMINNEYAVPSPFDLFINQQLSPNSDSIYVSVLGKATSAVSGALVFQCAVIEKHIHFNTAPGSNGEKDFYNVMKEMLPSALGTNLPTSFQPGDYFLLQFAWKLANVYDNTQLSVVGFIQDASTKTVYQSAITTETPITGVYQNDANLMNISNIQTSYCEPSCSPVFQVQNNGSSPLTSCTIKYRINDEPEGTFQWTGNLGFLQKASIALPVIPFTIKPENMLKIYCVSTNGVGDQYTKNDTIVQGFPIAPMPGMQVTVSIKTDNKPEETTWTVKDIAGNTIASGGPYVDKLHVYTVPVQLSYSTCYEFTLLDSGGDGLCCNNGYGFYELKNGSVIVCQGHAFTNSVGSQFYSASQVGLGESPVAASFSVFPNPVWHTANVAFANEVNEPVSIQVQNLLGYVVINIPTREYPSGQHNIEVDCSKLRTGVYDVRLTTRNKVFNQKITVNR